MLREPVAPPAVWMLHRPNQANNGELNVMLVDVVLTFQCLYKGSHFSLSVIPLVG